MEEDESIAMYNNTLNDMANESFSLGEPTSNKKLDSTTMSLDELIGNLETFEMSPNEGTTTDGRSQLSKGTMVQVSQINPKVFNAENVKALDIFNQSVPTISRGFGHIQSECPNYLKKQSKNYSSTLSDDESEDG
ncbi:hypothetical protein LIER_18904 [Lithospermum erythrorhizon]|uniref:Gag-pol polyprotein n=1 Tax=Lithospermum erythrorhizon TaxID=34254 RepID=A0AAV3QID6_LITER